ncbi:MAG: AGE family epimerase/isomerase [Lachnospiraceae bacterium]|nr:AGE family epimerase/isomerase [Lachnospiraceae bacterium]
MTAESFKQHLTEDLIPFWNRLRDNDQGGFYGEMDQTLLVNQKADKGAILNSRILWFYSTAYRLFKDETLLDMAKHAYRFLKEACLDPEYGGIYWSVTYNGHPADDTKHSYNQAFAIYALSAYYDASGDRDALENAYALYSLLEDVFRDKDGYLEAFHRDFSPASNEKLSENGVLAERTMNTLLHVMEAYTELYRVDHSPAVGDSLREVLDRFREKIYNPATQSCEVFFDKDYHSLIDLESYGHNIEASWLIDRTCQVLGDPLYTDKMQPVIDGLAQTAYDHAYNRELHALNNEREGETVDCRKIWWVQTESVIGFCNAWQRHPDQTKYLEASRGIWEFITSHIIDKRCGEWFESLQPDNSVTPGQGIVHAWKCPYHNGRMCIEMIRRLSSKTEGCQI